MLTYCHVSLKAIHQYVHLSSMEQLETALRRYGAGYTEGAFSSQKGFQTSESLRQLVEERTQSPQRIALGHRVCGDLMRAIQNTVRGGNSFQEDLDYEWEGLRLTSTPFFKKRVEVHPLSGGTFALGLRSLEPVVEPDSDERGVADWMRASRGLLSVGVTVGFPLGEEALAVDFTSVAAAAMSVFGLAELKAENLADAVYGALFVPNCKVFPIGMDFEVAIHFIEAFRRGQRYPDWTDHLQRQGPVVSGPLFPRGPLPDTADVVFEFKGKDKPAVFEPHRQSLLDAKAGALYQELKGRL